MHYAPCPSGRIVTGWMNGISARRLGADVFEDLRLLGRAWCVLNHGRPSSFSLTHFFANVPSWISASSFSHFRARLGADDAWAGGVVAVLGGVADRVAHVVQAAAIHQVDDQLQLVQALEVGDLGLVARRRPAS